MSRQHMVEVTITNLANPLHRAVVFDILDQEMEPTELENSQHYILEGKVEMGGGQSEEEYTAQLAQDIWEALGRFVQVTVRSVCLADLPYEHFVADKHDFDDWKKR